MFTAFTVTFTVVAVVLVAAADMINTAFTATGPILTGTDSILTVVVTVVLTAVILQRCSDGGRCCRVQREAHMRAAGLVGLNGERGGAITASALLNSVLRRERGGMMICAHALSTLSRGGMISAYALNSARALHTLSTSAALTAAALSTACTLCVTVSVTVAATAFTAAALCIALTLCAACCIALTLSILTVSLVQMCGRVHGVGGAGRVCGVGVKVAVVRELCG